MHTTAVAVIQLVNDTGNSITMSVDCITTGLLICYMAFSLLRHLQYQVNLTQKVSIDRILDELLNAQSSIHRHKRNGDLYRLLGHFSHDSRKIYKETFARDRATHLII